MEISEKSIKRLDDLQHLFVRTLFRLPSSTPIPALRGISGLLGMKWRIWLEKISLLKSIKEQEESSISRMVLEEQQKMGWPGLSMEVSVICKTIGIKDVNCEKVSKTEEKKEYN